LVAFFHAGFFHLDKEDHQTWNHSIALDEHADVAGAQTVSNLLSLHLEAGGECHEVGQAFETTHPTLGICIRASCSFVLVFSPVLLPVGEESQTDLDMPREHVEGVPAEHPT